MRTEGRTDRHIGMTKLIVDFRSFANIPKTKRRFGALWAFFRHYYAFVISIHNCNGRSYSFRIVTLSAAFEFRCSHGREPL